MVRPIDPIDPEGGGSPPPAQTVGPRIAVNIQDTGRSDLEYELQWRPEGATYWKGEAPTPAEIDLDTFPTGLSVLSSFVPSVDALEYRLRAVSVNGYSDWVYGPEPLVTRVFVT